MLELCSHSLPDEAKRCRKSEAGTQIAQMARTDADNATAYPDHDYPLTELTGRIIGAFFEVHRTFGYGHFESVYRRSLAVELRYLGIPVSQEVPFELTHRGVSVGFYRADLIVDSTIVVEAKTGLLPDPVAPAQV